VTAIDSYLAELEAALHVRGAARRRFLRECRDHLADAAAERGDEAAVEAFGRAPEVAAAFDAEAAARRGLRSTAITVAGVVATGGSTLALINAASRHTTAPVVWTIAFFVAAQLAAVAAGLSAVQALVLRRSAMTPAELALLGRRNVCALAAAGVTMLSAGAAAPGHGSAAPILAGPALVCVAIVAVLRARSQARRLDGSRVRVTRQPLADVAQLTRLPLPSIDLRRALPFVTALAAAAAFARDLAEHSTTGGAGIAAGIEATAVVACFFVLGPALGLCRR
jgi:HAAS